MEKFIFIKPRKFGLRDLFYKNLIFHKSKMWELPDLNQKK
ncbi:hypothetical protein LEP1GSC083_5044 [Leptospira interrogans serovar Pyrogenes str. L0374]|uniref:Uncharacterized protein n=1 Tax=Leptospira interrogans serovar Pyrogenes str. L0374 TaxID=1049928 RepID=M6KDM9_LEPIR|nr:hypothetical protein LEP1GSC083_5044 [Leptospira interrogans serovar Pyrogenes str. L0374]